MPCATCGLDYPYLQRDHIVPKHLGGTDAPENIQELCPNCHVLKSVQEGSYRRAPGRKKGTKFPQSQATRDKISQGRRGIPVSEETKRKLALSNRGQTRSEATRRKLSERALEREARKRKDREENH